MVSGTRPSSDSSDEYEPTIVTRSRSLLEASRGGDREAFAELVRLHFRRAYVTALSIVGEPSDAEDVVQDAFVRCWQRLDQCRGDSSFPSWLRAIVKSVAMNHVERESVRMTSPLHARTALGRESPDRDLDRSELRGRLTEALSCLTPTQREVLLLYDLEGYQHAEIAGLLGISELGSRRHLSNARKRMRRNLGEPELRSAKP